MNYYDMLYYRQTLKSSLTPLSHLRQHRRRRLNLCNLPFPKLKTTS